MREPTGPFIRDGQLWAGSDPVPLDSAAWFEWATAHDRFAYLSPDGRFAAQAEIRRSKPYWYAYRRRGGRLLKVYLGRPEDLTRARLEQANATLSGLTPLRPGESAPNGLALGDESAPIDPVHIPLAKVNVPVLPWTLISRPRLTSRINTPLALIFAPSGFGKSTLLNEWRRTCGFPVAWLSLDQHDNAPARFWGSVILALQAVRPDLGHDLLAQLRMATQVPASDIIHQISDALVGALETTPRLGLVLDDFQRIDNAEIYDALQSWLQQLPTGLHLVLSGHIRPPLALGHLRARGLVTELDAGDLRFTTDEGIAYVRRYPQGPQLAYDDIERLVKRTEGWAAGLTLTALALSKQEDQRHFIDTFSGAHIYLREYFMETVLQRSAPDIQDFLLKTAILKNLSGRLCDAVTGQSDGSATLERLWRENLFTVRLEQDGWYRYHDLFAEMLRSQLQARFPDEIAQLHQRAAGWYREQFAPADAVYHLLATDAWEEAAALVEDMALNELAYFGEDSRFLRWLHELPASVVQKHKTLLAVYLRLANIALPQSKIEQFVEQIDVSLRNKPASLQTPDERDVLAEIRQIRASWEQHTAYATPIHTDRANAAKWELLQSLHVLKHMYEPDAASRDSEIAALYQAAQRQGNLFVILMAGGGLARRAYLSGQLRKGERIARQVLDLAQVQLGRLPGPASIPLMVLSQIHVERNDTTLAQQYLAQAANVDPNPTSSNMIVQIALVRARIESILGRHTEARTTLRTLTDVHTRRPSGLWTDRDIRAYEALVCLRQGDLQTAAHLLDANGEIGNHVVSEIVMAELALHQGQAALAVTLLDHLWDRATGSYFEPGLGAQVLHAVALLEDRQLGRARQMMADAIRNAATEQHLRPFLDLGARCVPLLTVIERTEDLNREAQAFAHNLAHELSSGGAPVHQLSAAELDDLTTSATISAREQSVLRLIHAGRTNREIAAALCISPATAKTHLANIYCKLGVNGRVQALARAQALKLV